DGRRYDARSRGGLAPFRPPDRHQPTARRQRPTAGGARQRGPGPDLRSARAHARRAGGPVRRRASPPHGRAPRARPSSPPRGWPVNLVADPLQYEFFQRALAASALVGVVCAVVGTYMVLRGLAFLGDAISHAAFPGVVIAYLLKVPFYLGAAVAAVITSLAIGWVSRRGNLRGDTAIGVLFAGMFA